MANGIPMIAIGESTIYVSDGNYSSKYPKSHEFLDAGVPFVSANNLRDGRITRNNLKFIAQEQHATLKKGHVRVDDVLLVTRGSLGLTARVTQEFDDANINAQLVLLRADNKTIDARYLFFAASSPGFRSQVLGNASGTAQPQLPIGPLKRLKIPLPPLPTQRRIASILSAYDDLIENNTRRIEILEEMARSLYREWFVYFRFPGHEKVKLVDSELGKIPEEWEVAPLDAAFVMQRGFDLPKGTRVEGDIPIYASTGITGFHNEAKAHGPAVVTGRSGTIGEVQYVEGPYWPLNTALWSKELRRVSALIAYFMLKELDFGGIQGGAAVPTLNRNHLHARRIPIPPSRIVSEFDTAVRPIIGLARMLGKKNTILRQTRDLLLPKLISGEIDVDSLDLPEPS